MTSVPVTLICPAPMLLTLCSSPPAPVNSPFRGDIDSSAPGRACFIRLSAASHDLRVALPKSSLPPPPWLCPPCPPPPVPEASPSSICMPAREEVSPLLLALVQLASRLESAYLRALIGLVSAGRNGVHRATRVSFILHTRLCCQAWRQPVARRQASQLLLRKREDARPGCNEHLVIHNGVVN